MNYGIINMNLDKTFNKRHMGHHVSTKTLRYNVVSCNDAVWYQFVYFIFIINTNEHEPLQYTFSVLKYCDDSNVYELLLSTSFTRARNTDDTKRLIILAVVLR